MKKNQLKRSKFFLANLAKIEPFLMLISSQNQ